ncbi:hypothetical protein CRE_25397 [Caenorhabditis remanei]|uniref:DUF7107 domain-containing protein n=1 Tax=Caenorhabditis remanei TaxID=31234 RepID=E3LSY5_CAERE|nr:hypothetical protein CRE_25397 [Caenorhabditis remanei]
MVRLLIIILLTSTLSFGDKELNLTSSEKSDNRTSSGKQIHIPTSSEVEEELRIEKILEKSKEFDDVQTTTDIPYLPLIQRCSIDDDCSSETACFDGKCLNATRFHLFPYLFRRCQSRLDCPTGHRCIISMCIPFRW